MKIKFKIAFSNIKTFVDGGTVPYGYSTGVTVKVDPKEVVFEGSEKTGYFVSRAKQIPKQL